MELCRFQGDLNQYRPLRRPVANSSLFAPVGGAEIARLRKKRKLIVRDWLHFVVWYVRVRQARLLWKQQGSAAVYNVGKLGLNLLDSSRKTVLKVQVHNVFYQGDCELSFREALLQQ